MKTTLDDGHLQDGLSLTQTQWILGSADVKKTSKLR